MTVNDALADIFNPSSTPRSRAYRQGCQCMLSNRLDGVPFSPIPYDPGSSDYDAYFSGADRARFYLQCQTL